MNAGWSYCTKEKNNLEFEVLTDYNNEVARQFHITFTLNDELIDIYNDFHKLEIYNRTARTPDLCIDTNGIIKYAFIDTDYRKRAEPADILAAIKAI